MGSVFLQSGADILALQDGTFSINIASATIQNLSASLPVKTDSMKQLTSGLIQLSDCNFSPITNPMGSDLNMANHNITNLASTSIQSGAAGAAPAVGYLKLYQTTNFLHTQNSANHLEQLAYISDLGSYLSLSGGTMLGSIDMGTNNITDIGSISGATYTIVVDNIVNNTGAGVSGNIPSFSSSTGKVIQDSGISVSSIASTTSLTGIYSNIANIVPRGASDTWTNVNPANSPPQIVYASSLSRMIGFDNNAFGLSYSNDNGITWTIGTGIPAQFFSVAWSGTVFAAVQTVGSPAAYTSPDGITWTAQAAPPFIGPNDVIRMEFINGLFMIGTNSGTSGIMTSPDGITWTARASTRAPYRFATNGSTIVGASPSGFVYSTNGTIWTNTVDSFACRCVTYSSARREFIAASSSSTTTYRSPDGITWTAFTGNLPVSNVQQITWVPNTARYYIAAQNPTTLLYSLYSSTDGVSAFTGINTMQGATAVGANFYDLFYISSLDRFYIISNTTPRIHYSTNSTILSITNSIYSPISPFNMDSTGTINIGPTTATAVNIGRSTIPVICNGIFSTSVSYGSWYSTTSYTPAFSAGVNRLTPPTASTAGTLVDFTQTLGVLTYTGTRTRTFVIDYDVTFSSGASTSNMTFFNSINASTTIGTQTQVRWQVTPNNNATFGPVHFSDIITLNTNDTVQLAGQCAILSSSVGYQYVSCKIRSLLN